MYNTLYLPELREMLTENNAAELRDFCSALHPANVADFMQGLEPNEIWAVLKHADSPLRAQIFSYFDHLKQVEVIETQDRGEVAVLVAELAPDDRVDVLEDVDDAVVDELMPLLPADERRDILRLRAYPEGTAGAVMTTDVAMLPESMHVREALASLSRQAEELETIYYLYVVDDNDHLRGVVSVRQLVSALKTPEKRLSELMETGVVACNVWEDQEEVAQRVADFDFLAIPVVDKEQRLLGIITHDDVIDVMREEATEDAHRSAAVEPLDHSYLKTNLLTLSWKRGQWLTILFFGALLTASALKRYEDALDQWKWLVLFIPLVVSSGGNSGNQSATLIITGLATGDVKPKDWLRIVGRELAVGLALGAFLGIIGYFAAWAYTGDATGALVMPLTLTLVIVSGTMVGSLLPLLFQRLGLDPALMSNPFVAGIVDILGIVIYVNVALQLLI